MSDHLNRNVTNRSTHFNKGCVSKSKLALPLIRPIIKLPLVLANWESKCSTSMRNLLEGGMCYSNSSERIILVKREGGGGGVEGWYWRRSFRIGNACWHFLLFALIAEHLLWVLKLSMGKFSNEFEKKIAKL
jgi:hypothetical protein